MLGDSYGVRIKSDLQKIKADQESAAVKLADMIELVKELKKMVHLINEKLKK